LVKLNDHTFTVCGAGRAGSTIAADMALMGYKINLFELEAFSRSIEPIIRRGGIDLSGMSLSGETGLAVLNRVTTKAKEAIEESDLIFICAPAFGHRAFFKAIMPYLKEGQAIMVNTGYWASLRIADMLRNEGVLHRIILGEANIFPYLCDKSEHKVHVYNIKRDIQLATFPGENGDKLFELVKSVYPQHRRVPNVLWTNFAPGNPSVHATLLLPIMGLPFDMFRGCKLYGEATVCGARLVDAFDDERIRVARALDCKVKTAYEWVQEAYGYDGENIAEAFRRSPHAARYIPRERIAEVVSEDIEYFYVPLTELGRTLSIKTPVTNSIIEVMGVMLNLNYWMSGITLERLGLQGMTAKQIINYVNTGDKDGPL
jgi:opine dehydrogenase